MSGAMQPVSLCPASHLTLASMPNTFDRRLQCGVLDGLIEDITYHDLEQVVHRPLTGGCCGISRFPGSIGYNLHVSTALVSCTSWSDCFANERALFALKCGSGDGGKYCMQAQERLS